MRGGSSLGTERDPGTGMGLGAALHRGPPTLPAARGTGPAGIGAPAALPRTRGGSQLPAAGTPLSCPHPEVGQSGRTPRVGPAGRRFRGEALRLGLAVGVHPQSGGSSSSRGFPLPACGFPRHRVPWPPSSPRSPQRGGLAVFIANAPFPFSPLRPIPAGEGERGRGHGRGRAAACSRLDLRRIYILFRLVSQLWHTGVWQGTVAPPERGAAAGSRCPGPASR